MPSPLPHQVIEVIEQRDLAVFEHTDNHALTTAPVAYFFGNSKT
jgi:hypothetical protein